MATMITEVYEAFRKVGIPNPEAKQAAEALSAENVSTKADINAAEERLRRYIDKSKEELNGRITDLDNKLSERITDLDDKLSDRITALDEKLSEKISREIAEVRGELSGVKVSITKLDRQMAVMKWMMATTIAGILSLLVGVASIGVKIFFSV